MECLKCGTYNPKDAQYCQNCGKPLKKINDMWILAAILIPIVSLIFGTYYACIKKMKGTGLVIALSVIFLIIYTFLFFALGWNAYVSAIWLNNADSNPYVFGTIGIAFLIVLIICIIGIIKKPGNKQN